MSIVLAVYSREAFKEFILPPLNNSDYSIYLEKEDFQIREDISLAMEVLDEAWRIKEDSGYRISMGQGRYRESDLKDKDLLTLENRFGEKIFLIIRETESIFHVCPKYDISQKKELVIGYDPKCDIIYDYMSLVSKEHARIIIEDGTATIIDHSVNGTYVNSERIISRTRLSYGDYINIVGLHLIWLGRLLAVDEQAGLSKVRLKPYRGLVEEGTRTLPLNERMTSPSQESGGKIIYHRFPRNYDRLNKNPVEIEDPPELMEERPESLLMAIGPSITMALPLLLGCSMMLYASRDMGSFALFLYSGLAMALAAALVGVIWSLSSIRQQRSEKVKKDKDRFDSYSRYLIQKTDYIKKEYESSKNLLEKSYPSAMDCLCYDETGGNLWNRNRSHEDFLTHRIGKGDIPFQMPIVIPKERFRIQEDDLAGKPAFIKENYQTLYRVPVTIDFKEHPLIGVIGGEKKKGALDLARIILAQLAANTCYTDVKLAVVYNGKFSTERESFAFARWLPHTWSEDHRIRYIASDPEEAGDVFYELSQVFRTRAEEDLEDQPIPAYIVIVTDPSFLNGEIFARYVFDKDHYYGLTTLLLVEHYEDLPNSCDFIVQNDDYFWGYYRVGDREEARVEVRFDDLDPDRLDAFSRNLSRLRVTEIESGGDLPVSLSFFEMLGIRSPEDLPVKELWMKNRIYDNIRAMIGVKAGGVPCYLDVHEKYHGPHGLVAGTTGSGKSELLQTWILSLAANYSPEDVVFFLIDYKGGGMAHLFDGLPHLAGAISNLSGNQVRRAMISIKSENRRRQRLFNENGVNNINAYTRLYKNKETALPIPHLFLIIDEFAELKREEPDFMKELISVAQVGRSLGVHLVLATQKPGGTVDDNIWSNSRFRLCLRVQDRKDSQDLLHKPDAAYITQAGRSYLQVGSDEIYELFQSGYSGAIYDERSKQEGSEIARLLKENGRVELTGNMAKADLRRKAQYLWLSSLLKVTSDAITETDTDLSKCIKNRQELERLVDEIYWQMQEQGIDYGSSRTNTERLMDFVRLYYWAGSLQVSDVPTAMIHYAAKNNIRLPEAKEKTQLAVMKDRIARVAEEEGYTYRLKLWMPVLPDKIFLEEFPQLGETTFPDGWKDQDGENWSLEVIIGKLDDPENQNQLPLTLDLARDGHLAVCGSVASGKSTLLQTLMYALIKHYSPKMLHLYAIDFSSKMLAAFENAPQVGGIMLDHDLEKISKFFHMIETILEERKALFKGGNYAQYVKVNGIVLPAIIVIIDNYASLKEKTEGAYEEILIRLSREGVNYGISLVVSGTGFGLNDISSRVGDNMGRTLCLALPDLYAYTELLHSSRIEVLPETGIRGRGLIRYEKRILEFQTALAVAAGNDYQRMEWIESECLRMKEAWQGRPARRIPEIPEKPSWSLLIENDEFESLLSSPGLLPVGYDKADASLYGIPLSRIWCYVIWGSRHSGKTNLMRVCIQSALAKKGRVIILDSPKGEYALYKDQANVCYAAEEEAIFDAFSDLLPEFQRRNRRKHSLLDQELEEEEIFRIMSQETPYFIFAADLAWFIPFVYRASLDMKGFLENIMEKGRLHHIYFFSELSLEKRDQAAGYPLYEIITGYRTGIHLGGKVADNPQLTFDSLSYAEQAKAKKSGIGQLPDSDDEAGSKEIVIPLARR